MRSVTVLAPGPLSTIQDLGRSGYGHLGVGRSGAADRRSLGLANRVVGNEKHAAAIEMTMGRLRLRFETDAVVTVTGAPCPLTVAGRGAGMNTPVAVRAGEEVRVGPPSIGLRTYLALNGGVAVPSVLGSRSTDTLSGIGPEKLSAGMVLPIGEATGTAPAAADSPELDPDPVLTVHRGPRDDWFTPQAWQTLCSTTWTATPDANRIGVRLAGPALERHQTRELPSEPMVVGALQAPPDGQPILFLADHPVTGGYPVIAVVCAADVHLAAQLRPGRTVRFQALG